MVELEDGARGAKGKRRMSIGRPPGIDSYSFMDRVSMAGELSVVREKSAPARSKRPTWRRRS